MTIYLVIFKPFRERNKNYLEILNESCILFSAFMLFGFSNLNPNEVSQVKFAWTFCGILFFNVGVNVVKGLIDSFLKISRIIREKILKKLIERRAI